MKLVHMLLDRLREPSTMAGLAGLAAAVGITIPGELVTQIGVVVGGIAAIASMFMKEKGNS